MGNLTQRVKVIIDVVADNARTTFSSFKKDIADAEGVTGKFGAAWRGAGDLIKQNALVIGTAAVAVVGGAYKMAQGAAETDAAFASLNQIAGETIAKDVAKWAENGVRAFGMSDRAIYTHSKNLANIGDSVGYADDKLRDFIGDHLKMSADFAAFADTNPDQVMKDIQSGYAGSTETLQKYGVFANEANLKTALLNETGKKVTGTLSVQERTLGINLLLKQKHASIDGQWARESGELAGQQARLGATWTNIQDTIGRAVLPTFTKLFEVVNENAEAIESMAETTSKSIASITDDLGELISAASEVRDVWEEIPGPIREAAGWLSKWGNPLKASIDGVRDFTDRFLEWKSTADMAKMTTDEIIESLGEFDRAARGRAAPGLKLLTDEAKAAQRPFDNLTAQIVRNRQATQNLNAEIAKERRLLDEAREAARRKAGTVLDLADAQDALADSIEESNAVAEDEEATQRDVDAALRGVTRSADDLAQTHVELKGHTLDSRLGQLEWNRSMLDTAATLNGPQRKAILDHIARVNEIPDDQITRIDALIEMGKFTQAQRLLDDLTKPRTVTINPNMGRGDLRITPKAMARGGISPGGLTLLGEEGPELADLPGGTRVYPADQTARMLGGNTTIVYAHFPAGFTPADAEAALRRWERRNGPRGES